MSICPQTLNFTSHPLPTSEVLRKCPESTLDVLTKEKKQCLAVRLESPHALPLVIPQQASMHKLPRPKVEAKSSQEGQLPRQQVCRNTGSSQRSIIQDLITQSSHWPLRSFSTPQRTTWKPFSLSKAGLSLHSYLRN